MLNLLFITIFSFNLLAIEVVTIDSLKNSKELSVSTTDDSFMSDMDKAFITSPCKLRTNSNILIKETFYLKSCRAQIIKHLLGNGYKADPYFKIFTK